MKQIRSDLTMNNSWKMHTCWRALISYLGNTTWVLKRFFRNMFCTHSENTKEYVTWFTLNSTYTVIPFFSCLNCNSNEFLTFCDQVRCLLAYYIIVVFTHFTFYGETIGCNRLIFYISAILRNSLDPYNNSFHICCYVARRTALHGKPGFYWVYCYFLSGL